MPAIQDKKQQVKFSLENNLPRKFNSLPRRKSHHEGESAFERNAPVRRSAGPGAGSGADRCVEYFVPRSYSEYNLHDTTGELYNLSSFAVNKPERSLAKTRDKVVTFEEDRAAPLTDDIFM